MKSMDVVELLQRIKTYINTLWEHGDVDMVDYGLTSLSLKQCQWYLRRVEKGVDIMHLYRALRRFRGVLETTEVNLPRNLAEVLDYWCELSSD